jgi:glycosyltransferase involved in cell wall biosynthesis
MVTVIIPNYNHAAFIRQRIDSVLNQTYQDFELIILDDCSQDSSIEIIEEYRENSKISQIVFNEENSGSVFKQWEKGIGYAKGDFIWIAESDDFADRRFLEKLVPLIQQSEENALVYCDSFIVRNDRLDSKSFAEYRNEWLHSKKWNQSYVNNGKLEIDENLLEMCTINNASSVLFRRSALLKISPFDLNLRYIGDWYIYLKLCNNYRIVYCNEPLNYYREHANNTFKGIHHSVIYVQDYFLVFDWVYRNIDFVSKARILNHFKGHTRHSPLRLHREGLINLYAYFFKLNRKLFITMLWFNLKESVKVLPKKVLCL